MLVQKKEISIHITKNRLNVKVDCSEEKLVVMLGLSTSTEKLRAALQHVVKPRDLECILRIWSDNLTPRRYESIGQKIVITELAQN